MEPAYLAVLLLAVTLALITAEFFIPSGGLIGVMALLCLAASFWFAWQAWGGSSPSAWWGYVMAVVLLLPLGVGGMLYIFPRTSYGRQILLEPPRPDEVASYSDDEAHLMQMVGKTGKTLNLLTPGGLALIDGERVHCESEGLLIDPNQPVEVVAVKGNRVVVRLIEHSASPQKDAPAAAAADRDDADLQADAESAVDEQLDFDVPQS